MYQKNFADLEGIFSMRLLAKGLAFLIGLLVLFQFFAVVVESQVAAVLSWYLIYALAIVIPLTLVYEGFNRFYLKRAS